MAKNAPDKAKEPQEPVAGVNPSTAQKKAVKPVLRKLSKFKGVKKSYDR